MWLAGHLTFPDQQKGRKMSFQKIFLPVIFLPGFQSDRSEAFFDLIVQVENIYFPRITMLKWQCF